MTTPLLGPASGTTTPHGAPSGPTHAGGPRVLAHGRDSGLPDVDALAAETLAAYAASDACCPDGFPELPRAEASLVGFGLDLVDAPRGAEVEVTSLQERGAFRATLLQGNFADDDRTLVALALSGEPLDLDHGYPARLIAPNRPGVLQTKWLSRLEAVT